MNLKELKKIILYKWRVQSYSKSYPSCTCVAYIDARDVMDILDEVCGPENWQSDYKEIKGNLFAGIAIKLGEEWVWKWDCGTESNTEKEKGEASDAFKRAAVKWGVGRFLYDLEIQYVKASDKKEGNNFPYPVNDRGEKIKDLTLYLNENNKLGNKSNYKPAPASNGSNVDEIIKKVKACKNIDQLRKIREENKDLEKQNNTYKRALADRYETLPDSPKIDGKEIADAALAEIGN